MGALVLGGWVEGEESVYWLIVDGVVRRKRKWGRMVGLGFEVRLSGFMEERRGWSAWELYGSCMAVCFGRMSPGAEMEGTTHRLG